jgi:predicted short-subunit dehydrogenase-like oxidoreductase (DUF2520 family)
VSEDLTLVDIERHLRRLANDLGLAQKEVADCRNVEVYTKHEYEQKQRRLVLSPNAPQVGRGDGKVTAAEKEAWVDINCEEQQQAYDLATVRREAASEHLRTLRDQASIIQTLARAVQVSMGLVGTTQP